MRKTLTRTLFPLIVAGAIFAGGCVSSPQKSNFEPIGKTPSGETIYRQIPVSDTKEEKSEKQTYPIKSGGRTTGGLVQDFFGCLISGGLYRSPNN